MRTWLFNLHLYLALVVGIFVVVIGVTGSIVAFEEDLDHFFNTRLFYVEATGTRMPAADLFAAAAAAFPGQKIGSLRLPQSERQSVMFTIKGPRQAFVNPYNGQLLGTRDAKTPLQTIHTTHLSLLMGTSGRNIVAAVTAILLVLVASGVYLWWPLKRASVKWNASARRIHFDLHNAAGIYSATFLVVLGITGITVYFDGEIERYLHQRAGTAPVSRNVPSVEQQGVNRISADQALASAAAALPGTTPLSITLPANAKGSYLVTVRYPEDLTPGGRSWVNVDQYSGTVSSLQSSRTAAAASRTIILNRAIHTGDIFGYPTKVLVSLSSLMLVLQAVTGYYLWWKKLAKNVTAEPQRRADRPGDDDREIQLTE
jgi:uncharacterized iron-regulated membrane protein